MKKTVFTLTVFLLFCSDLTAACYGYTGCEDMIQIEMYGQNAQGEFEQLDQEVAREIDKIKEKIKESHDELENDSKTILENTRKLNREFFVMEQNILHNQIIINDLQNLVIDAIGSSTEVKSGENSLEFLKKEFDK